MTRIRFRALLGATLLCVPPGTGGAQDAAGAIRGRVLDPTGAAISGARVALIGTPRATYSDGDGAFVLADLPARDYQLRVQRLGFEPSPVDSIALGPGQSLERTVTLQPLPERLSQVVVSPGSYSLLDARTSQQTLTREQLLTSPQLAEDLFRSLNRLPGLSGSDYSAKLRVRNGGHDELLVLLDGLELVEPFHLKDFDGALSILDAEAIGNVELKSGGFGAQYGNRTTGVIAMTSASPDADRSRNSVGLSFSNVRARTEGRFSDGKGQWMASARRGYLDLIFKLIGEEDAPDPRYYDIFGKVQRELGSRHILAAHTLLAGDEMHFTEDSDATFASSHYDNQYVWASLKSQLSDALSVTTLASLGRLTWNRDGKVTDFYRTASNVPVQAVERARVNDDRLLNVWSIKQDWIWDVADRLSLLGGGEFRDERSDLKYRGVQRDYGVSGSSIVLLDTQYVQVALAPEGPRVSGWAAIRAKPWRRLTTEVGLRADRHGWTDQSTTAPRTSAAFEISSRTTLRAAWGVYPQAHAIHDLSVVDGDTVFSRAERAEHRVVGLEHALGRGWSLRIEGYQRLLEHPRPRWINTDGNNEALPEIETDRVRLTPSDGRVRGLEWLATYDPGGRSRASLSYVLSKATATQSGLTTPRPFDERHAIAIDYSRQTAGDWTWALAFTLHSGWPVIPGTFKLDTISLGPPLQRAPHRVPSPPFYTERLGTYQRFDMRVSKSWNVANGRHRISAFAETFNTFNHDNPSGSSYNVFMSTSGMVVQRFRETFLPRLPSLGARWEF